MRPHLVSTIFLKLKATMTTPLVKPMTKSLSPNTGMVRLVRFARTGVDRRSVGPPDAPVLPAPLQHRLPGRLVLEIPYWLSSRRTADARGP